MFWVVYGGSGSGKSEFAENTAVQLKYKYNAEKILYIATMKPYGAEGKKRIERHRKMREGKGFETLEVYNKLKNIEINSKSIVLLECMSNLVANEMFDEKNDNAQNDILCGIEKLAEKSLGLIVVTNDIFCDGIKYDCVTEKYMKLLGNINIKMAEKADIVTEIVYSREIRIKG